MLILDQPLIRKHSYLIIWYHAVLDLTPLRLQTLVFMPGYGARGQNLGHLRIFKFFFFFFSFMESFVFEQQVLFWVDFIYGLRPYGSVPQGGPRGQNLEHLRIFFLLLFFFYGFNSI